MAGGILILGLWLRLAPTLGQDLKTIIFEFIMFLKLIGAAVVSISFVLDIMANLLEGFLDIKVEVEQLSYYIFIYL